MNHLGGENLGDHLASMTREFNRWCQSQKIRTAQTCICSLTQKMCELWVVQNLIFFSNCIYTPLIRHYQHPICSALITVKQGEYPELRIKAWAGRVMIVFLQHKVAELIRKLAADPDVEGPSEVLLLVNAVLSSICQWFASVEKAGRYLTEEESNSIWGTSLEILGKSRLDLLSSPLWLGCLFMSRMMHTNIYVHSGSPTSQDSDAMASFDQMASAGHAIAMATAAKASCSLAWSLMCIDLIPGLSSDQLLMPGFPQYFASSCLFQDHTCLTSGIILGISRDQFRYEGVSIQCSISSLLHRRRYAGDSEGISPTCSQTIDGVTCDGTFSPAIEDFEEKDQHPSTLIDTKSCYVR